MSSLGTSARRRQVSEIEEISSAAAKRTVKRIVAVTLPFGLEVQVRLAEVAGEAVDLGGCQGGSGLSHSSLQKRWNWRKPVWETSLSLPSPATPLTRKFGIY